MAAWAARRIRSTSRPARMMRRTGYSEASVRSDVRLQMSAHRLHALRVSDDRFPGGDPSLDIVDSTTAAKGKKNLRLAGSECGRHAEPFDTITHRGTSV